MSDHDHPVLGTVLDRFEQQDGAFVGDAPLSWAQGRTLYGGMTAALAWAMTTRAFPDLAPLRSAQVAFVGPAAGRLAITPRLVRQGRSAAFLAVSVSGEAGPAAECLFSCGHPRESVVRHAAPPAPEVPAPEDCPLLFGGAPGPDFARNFEMRIAGGNRPLAQGEPTFTCWTRFTRAQAVDPLTGLIALADALPPAAMVSFPKPSVISSMTWSIELDALPTDADGWFLQRSEAEDSADGYSRQAMTLWDAAGRRFFAARQTVAIFV